MTQTQSTGSDAAAILVGVVPAQPLAAVPLDPVPPAAGWPGLDRHATATDSTGDAGERA